MNNGLRLAVTLPILLLAPAALADSSADPDGATVVVVTPSAPVVVGVPPHGAPPGAAEVPPQPAVAAATLAPQNEDWNNVSHINGEPVPVGERGNYLYKWKKTNIATNPIGWMIGIYGLSISHAINSNIAIRGDGNLFREIGRGDDAGYEFGVTLPVYFKRVYQGPFVEPGLLVRDFDTSDQGQAFTGPQVNVGWHWTFDSGLNMAFAVGLARSITDTSEGEFDSGDEVQPTGYFRIGYAY